MIHDHSFVHFQVTEDVRNALCDWFEFECRGTVKVKGKGEMTTYWLKGKKTARGLPSPRPFGATDSSKQHTPQSASSLHPPNSANENRASKTGDHFSTLNETTGCSKSKHAPLKQTSSNTSHSSTLNTGIHGHPPLPKNKSDSSIGSPTMTQSPTSSLTSGPLSPSGIVRAYDQEHAQKIDLQMNMPTPPGSLSRRRNNLESPRDSRNPLKKFGNTSLTNCISSQGPPSECSSTYMRVDSPELPAVHFRNVKMGDGDERHSTAIQNELFDSLKVGLDVKHNDKAAKGKRKSNTQRTGSETKISDAEPGVRKSQNIDVQPPPIPSKNRDSIGFTQSQHQLSPTLLNGHQNNRLSQGHASFNSDLGRPIVPYQVSNPIVPHMQKTVLVQAGLTNPILGPIRPAPCQSPKQVSNPSSLFFPNTQAIKQDLASIEEVPLEEKRKRSNMLKELQKTVNANEPLKKKEKPPIAPKSSPPEATYSVINKNPAHVDGTCEEQFVTAVYREPIAGSTTPNKSPSATPPIRSTPVPRNPHRPTPRTTPNLSESPRGQNDREQRPGPLTRLPPRPTPPEPRRTTEGTQSQRSSTSSQSTITPTTSGNPIVASIDGKTMSLFGGFAQPVPTPSDVSRQIGLLKRSPSDSTTDRMQNRKSVPQVKRSNSSPKLRPRGLPIRMAEDGSRHVSVLSDDDESVASHQQSDCSSVVLLQPIELKLARPALVRQIGHQGHHMNNFMTHDDFVNPHLHRQLSRSSDTINSIPNGQRTPKFPLTSAESTSLTQLLQELANDHPSLNIHKSILADNNDSDDEFDVELDNGRIKGFNEFEPLMNGANHYVDKKDYRCAIGRKDNNSANTNNDNSRQNSDNKKNGPPGKAQPNPYQVKRRNTYTIPPRYCRSLDYIPSDREDHVSSNQSSACGSPKSRHDISAIQAYMMPFFSGRNPLGIESISVSSIASSSEMSRSDPAMNTMEGGSSAYESEYDNYRPGMTSDEDFFHPDPISDMDIDIFDDMNVDNVTVSDHYSLDLPPLPVFPKKKITDV